MTRKYALLLIPCFLFLALGCGSKGGTVTGTVSYKGTPIPDGSIEFSPENGGLSVVATITDGKYTAEKVPVGPAKLTIKSAFAAEGGPANPMARAMQQGTGNPKDVENMPEGAKKWLQAGQQARARKGIKIPDKYSDPSKSGLTYTVKGGSQTHNIDLSD